MLRTSSEKQGEKERVRAALLRAALRLGAAHGFASLGLREVAREAGIAPTSFYRHFADMQELGLALSRELVGAAIGTVCAELRAGEGPLGALAWESMRQACVLDPELMQFFVAERVGASRSLRSSLQRHIASLAEALRAAAAGDAGGNVPSAAADAAALVLLDACVRTLDEAEQDRAALRESCLWTIAQLEAPSTARERERVQVPTESPDRAHPSGAKSGTVKA